MISDKQMKILAFSYSNYDALICDGAVRTGKTSIMMIAFIDDAMRRFNNGVFAICGRTVGSAIKNIINPYMCLSYANSKYKLTFKRGENKLTVKRGNVTNTFYVYGGKDESSYMLIQGITLYGVLIDEVTILVKSFVEQALARCSVEGSKFWFSCNPSTPEHWFYKEWVLKAKEKNALHLHFVMHDNPSLSKEMLERYENIYTGVFYKRYVKGEWVNTEGLVYSLFDNERNVINFDDVKEKLISKYGNMFNASASYYISCDYGITNPFAALLWCVFDNVAYCIDEYYYKASPENNKPMRTDNEHYLAIVKKFGGYNIEDCIIDPSATSFKEVIKRYNDFSVHNANNDVISGIAFTSTLIKNNKIFISSKCTNLLREIGLYAWNDKSEGSECVIKENDHACDAMRYFCYTKLRKIIDDIDIKLNYNGDDD